jgi:hypothetical protein
MKENLNISVKTSYPYMCIITLAHAFEPETIPLANNLPSGLWKCQTEMSRKNPFNFSG